MRTIAVIQVVNAGIKGYDHLHFGWFMVDWCNYNCSYCSTAELMRETYSKIDSNGKHKLVIERLKRMEGAFNIDLYGGEPTLHPDFDEILSALVKIDNCKAVEIKTNLSRSLAFYQRIQPHDKVKVSASYHPEYHSQAFIDKCIALASDDF